MVELPAAALMAANLLREADFLSLGSNDLTQYTLAVDRTNPLVANHFTPHHPAVLSLIKTAADAAQGAGKVMTACGEMAGSVRYCPVLLGLGITTLSMAGSRVPEVVDQIRRVSLAGCQDLALAMLKAFDADSAGRVLDAFLEDLPRRGSRR
jgi:phosphotransferase system enzyme I (PtsI)